MNKYLVTCHSHIVFEAETPEEAIELFKQNLALNHYAFTAVPLIEYKQPNENSNS